MSQHTKYGFCKGPCKSWVPRDEMCSINVSVYDAKNQESRIRMRFCPACHRTMQDDLSKYEWENNLKMEKDIMLDPELAENSNIAFDDSEEAMRKAGVLRDSVPVQG